jgi:hypothetical protein
MAGSGSSYDGLGDTRETLWLVATVIGVFGALVGACFLLNRLF